MSSIKTSAIVFKSINWKDTSRIVTLFTREIGKLNVIAKGARRSSSQYRGILESMNQIEAIIYYSANRQLQVLGQTSLEYGFSGIRSDYLKTTCTFLLMELTNTFFRFGSADPVYYDFFSRLLREMEESDQPKVLLWYFLLKLCSYLGFRPELKSCHSCGRELRDEDAQFVISNGALFCASCRGQTQEGWQLSARVRNFLYKLQNTNHKHITAVKFDMNHSFPFTDFLMTYLRIHSEERLDLAALKLLQ